MFVDGEFYSGISKEVAIANNFFVGKNIEKQQLDEILLQSQAKVAFDKATTYLETRLHSRRELKTKLLQKGFSAQAIDIALNRLSVYGYIDDSEFAKQYVNQNSKKSKQILKAKLIEKGIDKIIIDSVLETITDENQAENCLVAAQKYLNGKDKEQAKDKLFAHLFRKGFDTTTIKKVVQKLYNFDPDFE